VRADPSRVPATARRGLVQQSADRGKYRLGFGLVRLAGAVSGQLDITQQGRPIYERLADAFASRLT
jgi:DNA-binding IclR family transcriptional regulator